MAFYRSLAAGLLLLAAGLPAQADDAATVQINSIRSPELKPYRVMLAGLDAFDEYHALAPNTHELRFKLRLRSGAPTDATMDHLALRIAGNETSVPVALDADGRFTLPRIAALADDNADLLLNQKKGNYRWDADVRSDGLPDNMRRLGDFRLECEVTVAIVKEEIPLWVRSLVASWLLTTHWCASDKLNWQAHSPRRVRQATLVSGTQRISLATGDKGITYTVPTSDPHYPDDTLIELEYADAPE